MQLEMLGSSYGYVNSPFDYAQGPPVMFGSTWVKPDGTTVEIDDNNSAAVNQAKAFGWTPAPDEKTVTTEGKKIGLTDILNIIKTSGDTAATIISARYGVSKQAANEVVNMAKTSGGIGQYTPWFIVGGTALVLVLVMMGTRKRK